MPFVLEHIDAIARKLGRGVLFVDFPACHHDIFMRSERVDYEKYKPRKTIIRWLDKNGIGWRPCAGFADEILCHRMPEKSISTFRLTKTTQPTKWSMAFLHTTT